jgi:hypothetical protein
MAGGLLLVGWCVRDDDGEMDGFACPLLIDEGPMAACVEAEKEATCGIGCEGLVAIRDSGQRGEVAG